MSVNHKRKEKQLQIALSHIIQEKLTNANISFPTVTDVKLSNDGSHLKVYLTFINNEEKSLENLNNSKGVVKKLLGKSVPLRIVPNVTFHIDDSIEVGQRIEQILKEIKK